MDKDPPTTEEQEHAGRVLSQRVAPLDEKLIRQMHAMIQGESNATNGRISLETIREIGRMVQRRERGR